MSANDIPEWAWKRVREMVPEARLAERHFRDLHAAQAFARYIAAHEEAPVDPVEAAVTEALNASAFYLGMPDHYGVFAAHLDRLGLKIVAGKA